MKKRFTNEEFLQKLKDKNIPYMPLEEYKGMNTKIKWLCYKDSRHIFLQTPWNVLHKNYGCSFCSGHQVLRGYNDLWTLRPDIAKMLLNPEDGYLYTINSNYKTDWKCPDCGLVIKDKFIYDVSKNGLRCKNCSDGMSYAEKFIYDFLRQLKLEFLYDRAFDWSNNKRYDFYIPKFDMIIETHGEQHYVERFNFKNSSRNSRSLLEEIANDDFKMNLAIQNGIKIYIPLNCSVSSLEFIKTSVLHSELNTIFDLSAIDWNKCHLYALTSTTIYVCNLWNSGMKNTSEICKHTGFALRTVIKKLKLGTEIGLCDYIKYYQHNKNRSKKVLCIETQKIYESISSVKNDGYSPSAISNCCNGISDTAYGMHWKFV